ncbi:transposase [Streptomyces sp. NBC_00859]|uniref:transposase n=1 Tax=Streptomyces sp. NBC_00859 TaxID=2903682 RepID=UPI0038690EEC|nr:transposase [Streptomyces sp. NBC_00859]WSZ86766.1 transposase [Streptomyces sp. NBC_00859]
MTRPVVEVDSLVVFEGRRWRVRGIGPGQIWLSQDDAGGTTAVVALPTLLSDPGFEVVGGPPPLKVPQSGLLETVPAQVRERALAIARHVREVETGHPVVGGEGPVRDAFDPARTTLAQREQAKAEELTAAGHPVSRATVRRWRERYGRGGVWALVRKRRGTTVLGQADARVLAALEKELRQEEERSRSRGFVKRMYRQTRWRLEEQHGVGVVEMPAPSTFTKLLRRMEEHHRLEGTVAQRRSRSSRPAPPFTATVALRPGELVMMDSTPLDVLGVLDNGVRGRPELTTALDVATGSLWGILRPPGSKLTDVAVLLAQLMTPLVMRPGWGECLSMAASVIPHARLAALDERLAEAAARPVIVPETVVVDQGKVFVSPATVAACESLGISLQPVPPANGPAKGHVERTFGSVNTLFCQWLPGYLGSNVSERGSKVEKEPLWTLTELQALFDEFLAHWHHRPHQGLRHPLMPKKALTPNQMWAALLPVAGYVPVPLGAQDYVELLPVRWQAITDNGIRFDYRTYDGACLNGYRGEDSGVTARQGRWEVHHNPYDPARIWVRLADGFVEVPWIHATRVSLPFTHHVWEHICAVVERTASRDEHEAQLALALDDFLKRASKKETKLSRRERRVVAKSHAAQTLAAPAAELDLLSAPTLSFGLAGVYEAPEVDDETVPDEDDALLAGLEGSAPDDAPGESAGSAIRTDTRTEDDLWLL